MISTLRALCLTALLALATAACAAAPGQPAPLSAASIRFPSGALRGLDLYDGRANKTLTLPRQGQHWQTPDAKLQLALSTSKLTTATQWQVTLTNRGSESAWLLLRAYSSLTAAKGWRYFNGNYSSSPARPTVRTGLEYTMPMVAAYDGKSGVALGFEPSQIFSYLENGVVPGPTGPDFYYGLKLVLEPGKPQTITFVTFNFTPKWDERSAIAAYQSLYPAQFSPIPDGDPRLQTKGEAGSAPTWYKPSPETVRRAMSGCDWCYAPVKIPGDWFGRPEFWDQYNENVDEKKLKDRYGALEHWHQYLRDTFNRVDNVHRVAPYFYIINWTYYRLAEEKYRDAMVTDPLAQNRIAPWVTNKGPDVRVYLWGNKHAEQFQQDLRDLWQTYTLSGFGHDVATGGMKFRGAGLDVSPGRAWDAEGEYADVSVSVAKTADFIHALPRKQYRAGFWGNGSDEIYSIAVRSDASSFEEARYVLPGLDDRARYQRYIMGSKAIQLFSGDSRDNTSNYYKSAQTPPEDIKLMYRRVQLGAMQMCLKWGLLPCSDLPLGWQESWEIADLADRELFPYPWQLIPAAKMQGQAEVARYGTGLQSRFVVMNPKGVPADVTLQIDSADTGAKAVYALADGSSTTNRLAGNLSEIALKLPPAGIAVLLPVAQVTGTLQGPQTVARAADVEDGLRLTLPQTKSLRPLIPAGYEVAPDSPLHFSPKLFRSSEKSILDFFDPVDAAMKAGTPNTAGLEILASTNERLAAEAVQEYFRFYSEEVLSKPRLLLPIVTTPTAARQIRIVVASSPAVTLTGQTLTIEAPEQDLLDTTRDALRLLDRRFPFYGQIGRWVHAKPVETALRQKIGLAGGTVMRDGTIQTTPLGASLWDQRGKGPLYGNPW